MARSKSISGVKTTRGKKAQTVAETTASIADVKTIAAESGQAATIPVTHASLETTAMPAAPSVVEAAQPATQVKQAAASSAEPRKMEIVKNGARQNLVPINVEDEIRRRAYEIYQQRGSGSGSEADDWFAAEREVRQRYRQQTA